MLDSLITSKTRVKLLLKFFMNSGTRAYLRELSDEFNESTNGVRVELNRLTEAGLLSNSANGRTKEYYANESHPLFSDIQNLVRKYLGLDKLRYFISKLGEIKLAYVTGDYAHGKDSGIIDLVLVGEVDAEYLERYTKKTEEAIQRKIRTLVLDEEEFQKLYDNLDIEHALVLWDARSTHEQ